jgi:Type IV secretion system pilin
LNLTAVFTNLLNLLQAAGLVIGAFGLALGAALYALSGGNPHRKQTGLDAMVAGVIGGAVIVAATSLVTMISNAVGK